MARSASVDGPARSTSSGRSSPCAAVCAVALCAFIAASRAS